MLGGRSGLDPGIARIFARREPRSGSPTGSGRISIAVAAPAVPMLAQSAPSLNCAIARRPDGDGSSSL